MGIGGIPDRDLRLGGIPDRDLRHRRGDRLAGLAAQVTWVGVRSVTMLAALTLIGVAVLGERTWGVRLLAAAWGLVGLLWSGADTLNKSRPLERAAWAAVGILFLGHGIFFLGVGVIGFFVSTDMPAWGLSLIIGGGGAAVYGGARLARSALRSRP